MNAISGSNTLDALARQQPPGAGAGLGLFAKATALASTAMVATPLAALAVVAGKYAEIFRDFGVRLSPLTRSLLSVGEGIGTFPGVAVLIVATVIWFFAVFALASRSRGAGVVILACAILFCVVSVLSIMLGFFIPLSTIAGELQGQGAP